VEYLDLSETDGPDWRRKLPTNPAVIVSIDVNVHAKMDWWQQWPRALGICQWTLSSAPNHPIMLDAVRRVVNSTRVVENWEIDRAAEIEELERDQPEGYLNRVAELKSQSRANAMNVMEWTGPGLFSDAVLG
jgi:alpha 1,6-mannosyltransferase